MEAVFHALVCLWWLLLREVLEVLLHVGFRGPQVPDEDLGRRKADLQQPHRDVAEEEREEIKTTLDIFYKDVMNRAGYWTCLNTEGS